jgi:hypothetical protein
MLSRSVDRADGAETTRVRQTSRETGAQFRKHFERLATERRLADDLKTLAAPLATSTPSSVPSAAGTTMPVIASESALPAVETPAVAATPAPAVAAPSSQSRLSTTALSFLTDSRLPMLELLPATLAAGDAQYNTREVMLRERLNLQEVERRLRGAAGALEVSYDKSDLEGILRNAGYDAAHLGSTERYMAAIEKFVGEAENNYRQRAGNIPGKNA